MAFEIRAKGLVTPSTLASTCSRSCPMRAIGGGQEEVLLALEVAVESPLPHTEVVGEVLGIESFETELGEEAPRRLRGLLLS